jgi:hypothetical protein
MVSAYWSVYWTYNGVEYYAQATSNGSGAAAVWSFSDGTFSSGRFNPVNTITGTASAGVYAGGTAGTLVMQVPLADVGNPPAAASLTNTLADTHGSFTVNGAGLYYTAEGDRAPDQGHGAPWTVGTVC